MFLRRAEPAIRRAVIAITALLVLLAFALQTRAYGFGAESRGRWDLDNERTVPAAWSTLLFLAAAALSVAFARAERRAGGREWRWWIGLAIVAAAMGIDEFFSFHERTVDPVRDFLGPVGGPFVYAWVIPGVIGFGALCLIFARFISRLECRLRRPLVVGVMLLVAGGIGMEMLGGWWADDLGVNFGWMVLYTVEETLELAGATVIALALLAGHVRNANGHRPAPRRVTPAI